jgi:outer membrane lipoprotein-sorting protein
MFSASSEKAFPFPFPMNDWSTNVFTSVRKTAALAALTMALLPCLVVLPACAQGVPDADKILQRSRDRADGNDVYAQTQLVLIDDRGGQRVRQLTYLQKDHAEGEKLTLYFNEPADVRGVGFMSVTHDEKLGKDDDQWLYLPAYRQVRRIASSDKRGSFMGSEYAYIDLEKLRVTDYTQKVTGEDKVLERPCWVIERTPTGEQVIGRTGYHTTSVWVDKDSGVVLKQTYFDIKGQLFKTMTVKALERIQGIWTVMQSDMENHLTRKTSRLVFSDVRYDTGLPDVLFQQTILQIGVSRANLPALR